MTLSQSLFCAAALAFRIAGAEPVIAPRGVAGAATPHGTPVGPIARGSLFTISGENLGPSMPEQAGFPLPSSGGLAGTSVQISVGNNRLDALLVSTSATEVLALLPSKTPLGAASVTVTYQGRKSAPAPFEVVGSRFGIFTVDQSGSGQAAAGNHAPGWQRPNSFDQPARTGQTVALFGTGLGPVPFDEAVQALQEDLNLDVEVSVAGRNAYVLYKGRNSCCAGVDEIDIIIPDFVAGCSVPVLVRVGEAVSNAATLAIEPEGRTCAHPAGVSALGSNAAAPGE
ncbi:MAG TPA: IPT/TIG domain-containing protein [Bryobacteraceae bacterium]|jgi:uncharacterized protein (TIGR03437 family)|nr:IPT/TIG domain-containing protein [Bryobacteraceae bacterium]